jgi:two-component system LytT family response regulator
VSGPSGLGVLVVDDEEPARRILCEMIGGRTGFFVAAECANGLEAVRAAQETKPRIALLDIQMPRLDGFEVAELLDPGIAVVFVTAYDQHAVRAFEVHAVDYVLKPFKSERLGEALDRARERAGRPSAVDPARLRAEARGGANWLERIVVRDGSRIHVIPVGKLDAVEAQDDYVLLRTEGRRLLKPQTLASLAATLDPERFVRVHRSWIVAVERLARLELAGKNTHVAILGDGTKVPVSREGYARIRDLLGESPPRA